MRERSATRALVLGLLSLPFGGAMQATDTRPDGSRLVTASPSGGPFSITVAPAPLVLSACG
jgi:hypothetical protein